MPEFQPQNGMEWQKKWHHADWKTPEHINCEACLH